LGNTALSAVTTYSKIGEVRAEILTALVPGRPLVFPTWHPAYLLRNPKAMADWEEDLLKFAILVKLELGLGL